MEQLIPNVEQDESTAVIDCEWAFANSYCLLCLATVCVYSN